MAETAARIDGGGERGGGVPSADAEGGHKREREREREREGEREGEGVGEGGLWFSVGWMGGLR